MRLLKIESDGRRGWRQQRNETSKCTKKRDWPHSPSFRLHESCSEETLKKPKSTSLRSFRVLRRCDPATIQPFRNPSHPNHSLSFVFRSSSKFTSFDACLFSNPPRPRTSILLSTPPQLHPNSTPTLCLHLSPNLNFFASYLTAPLDRLSPLNVESSQRNR